MWPIGIPCLVFIIVFGLGFVAQQLLDRNWRLERRDLLDEAARVHTILLQRQLGRHTVAAHLLGHHLRENGGHIDNFVDYADRLMAEIGGIANLQLAPGGVISQIHPPEGHEAAIGYDILGNNYLRSSTLRAIESRTLTVVGPIDLIQGGKGILGRYPVFLPDGQGGETFWGLASALIRLDDFIAASQLSLLRELGLNYRLRYFDDGLGREVVFAGENTRPLPEPVVTAQVSLPNEEWHLDVAFARPLGHSPFYYPGLLLTALVAGVLAWISYLYLKLPGQLRREVAIKTQQLREMAFHDELTGLPNRKLLIDRLNQAIHRQQRNGEGFALLYIDLDLFKVINDTLGHQVGDKLLVKIANRLTSHIRKTDTAARIGGDEFTLLLMDVHSANEVADVATHLLARLREPVVVDSHSLFCTASIGVALCPEDGSDPEVLLDHGDLAMYRAKELGKNTVHFYSQALNQAAELRRELYSNLSNALAGDQLFLVYQPVISLATGRVTSVEALLRWRLDDGGVMLPGEFLSVIADSPLMSALGEFVVRRATEEITRVNRTRPHPIGLSINVTDKEFIHPGFADLVGRALGESLHEPPSMFFEITESTLANGGGETRDRLDDLRRKGVGIYLDRFGTGAVRIPDLKPPIIAVKLDAKVLAASDRVPSAVIAMCHLLGIQVVAQGVENLAELRALQAMGCDLAQGYLVCPPVAAEELAGEIQRVESEWPSLASPQQAT